MTKDRRPSYLMYSELASWFHLLTSPEDYREEADFYCRILEETARIPVKEVLEMGSGGGNNASHMKSRFALTLADLSSDMLAVSQKLNPECEHIVGDMRNMRLSRTFDAVVVHDAISYMTTVDDLKAAVRTAAVHCRPGGAVLLCPDYVRESFCESTGHGGHSEGDRGLRYLEWTLDPDPQDTRYVVHYAYMLKEGHEIFHRTDVHELGLFATDLWVSTIRRAGFSDAKPVDYPHPDEYPTPVFVGYLDAA